MASKSKIFIPPILYIFLSPIAVQKAYTKNRKTGQLLAQGKKPACQKILTCRMEMKPHDIFQILFPVSNQLWKTTK